MDQNQLDSMALFARVIEAGSFSAAALAGMGLIFMPTFIAGEDLRAGRLRWVMREWSDAEDVSIHAIYPANRNLSPKVRVFVDFLAGRFGTDPYWDRGLA